MRAAVLLAGVTALGSLPPRLEGQGSGASWLSICQVMSAPARCGTFQVWENRAKRSGRRIPLRVVIIPASQPERFPDPIVPLVGGPGEGAAASAGGFLGLGGGNRDLVLVDLRGTGASGPLRCEIPEPARAKPLLDSLFPSWLVGPCRSRLERNADLRQYTTRNKVADLAELLDSLGYPQVNLWGASYGTRTAMEFTRLYPARVRTVQLTAPLGPEIKTLPVEMARSAQSALDQVFAMCDTAPQCHKAFPGVRREFASLLARVSQAPVPVSVEIGGKVQPALLGRTGFGYAIRGALYGRLAQWLPLLIHRAAETGDLSWFARYWLTRGTWAWSDFPGGLYLSVVCTEDLAPVSDDSVRSATRSTFLGEGLYRQYEQACAQWPRGELPASLHELLRSPVPAVVISGTRDPVTPLSYATRVAAGLSGSVHVVFQNSGHGGAFICELQLNQQLLSKAKAPRLADLPCAGRAAPFEFALSGEPPAALMR